MAESVSYVKYNIANKLAKFQEKVLLKKAIRYIFRPHQMDTQS